ncbi:MAG: helix-turn-helix domain-containing protein [Candidatus Ventricola sp.]
MLYNSQIIGQVIGRLRTERGMSQEVLSGLSGIARSHLAMIENGRKTASVKTLWRIADALGMRLSELFHLIEEQCAALPSHQHPP